MQLACVVQLEQEARPARRVQPLGSCILAKSDRLRKTKKRHEKYRDSLPHGVASFRGSPTSGLPRSFGENASNCERIEESPDSSLNKKKQEEISFTGPGPLSN